MTLNIPARSKTRAERTRNQMKIKPILEAVAVVLAVSVLNLIAGIIFVSAICYMLQK